MDLTKLDESFMKMLKDNTEKYPDIKKLLTDYFTLKTQGRWTDDFLDGYLACISDLTYIKKTI